ncbi:hypothetical protein IPU70_30710 [Achromobacter sp. SD115]|uniref:hypothetical protein n=1 Tax=Achromobacter sp. SD115 TaxID=2782011 RepID=UPI001A961AC6|nr:hypothetical protein [Achromobacter sp. SD115]MBO1017963.1 hypothetical protein [Achromobacter sp. SD115]
MKGMLLGAALTLSGVLIGFVVATKVDVLADAKWWDLMTAFGTIGSALAAVFLAWWPAHKERRDRTVLGALAVYGQRDALVRIRLDLVGIGRDVVEAKLMREEYSEIDSSLMKHEATLDSMLQSRFADFDRAFVRHLLDARASISLACDPLGFDPELNLDAVQHLSAAALHIQSALAMCAKARTAMEAWWA